MKQINYLQANEVVSILSNGGVIKVMKGLADMVGELERRPAVKVDKGNKLTVRDKQLRKAMPKAWNEIDCRQPKDQILNRLMGNIERVRSMGKDKPQIDQLIAQMWIVYTAIEVHHVDDDHYVQTDIPQGKDTPIKSQPDGCQGWMFYKAKKGMQDSPIDLDGFWRLSEDLRTKAS